MRNTSIGVLAALSLIGCGGAISNKAPSCPSTQPGCPAYVTTAPDAGEPTPDAGQPMPDAGEATPDAGQALPDAGPPAVPTLTVYERPGFEIEYVPPPDLPATFDASSLVTVTPAGTPLVWGFTSCTQGCGSFDSHGIYTPPPVDGLHNPLGAYVVAAVGVASDPTIKGTLWIRIRPPALSFGDYLAGTWTYWSPYENAPGATSRQITITKVDDNTVLIADPHPSFMGQSCYYQVDTSGQAGNSGIVYQGKMKPPYGAGSTGAPYAQCAVASAVVFEPVLTVVPKCELASCTGFDPNMLSPVPFLLFGVWDGDVNMGSLVFVGGQPASSDTNGEFTRLPGLVSMPPPAPQW